MTEVNYIVDPRLFFTLCRKVQVGFVCPGFRDASLAITWNQDTDYCQVDGHQCPNYYYRNGLPNEQISGGYRGTFLVF